MNKLEFEQMETENMLQVGVVVKPHGVHGEVKVYPTTDDIKRFDDLREVWLVTKKGAAALTVEGVKYFKQLVILKFKDLDTVESIEGFRQCPLLVTREHAVKLAPGEYFLADVIGMKVIDEDEKELGTLVDVLQTGANDVYVVDMAGKEVLIPSIPDCILNRDFENHVMKIHVMDGLLD